MRRRMLSFLLALFVAYLALLGLLYALQHRLTYFPDRTPLPDPALFGGTTVTLATEDGLSLNAWWFPPASQDRPVVLYVHGNAGHLAFRMPKFEAFVARGFGVLAVSYRGYGGNPGFPSETGLYADARAGLGFLKQQGLDASRIIYYGESLGSGVAVQLATEAPPSLLALEAPYTSIVDVGSQRFPFIPVRYLMKERFDSLSKIARVQAPLLILHGEKDVIVPVSHGRALLAAAPEPKKGVFLAEIGHTDFDMAHIVRLIEELWNAR